MELHVVDDARALAVAAAARVAAVVATRPDALLLAATGDTPIGTYNELARLADDGTLDASRLRVAQLDEYLGLGGDDPRSLYGWMERALLAPLAIEPARIIRFDVTHDDPTSAARSYDAQVRAAGGVDLALLGLGPNGHLGFNEPPSGADAPTRKVRLNPETLRSNADYWRDAVPERALTAGMSVILAARRILVLVSGEGKASILDRMLRSEPDPGLPASFLHHHADTVVLADRDARPDRTPHA